MKFSNKLSDKNESKKSTPRTNACRNRTITDVQKIEKRVKSNHLKVQTALSSPTPSLNIKSIDG
jgi:hypothetical protein